MDSISLSYDPKEMDFTLAKNYFKERNNIFGVIEHGVIHKMKTSDVKDGYGNVISVYPEKDMIAVKSKWSSTRNADVLKKIAENMSKNCDLISQIEHLTRGISPIHTKKSLNLAVDFFQYYANFVSLLQNDPDIEKLLPTNVSYKTLNFGLDISLWELAHEMSIYLALGFDLVLHVSPDTTALSTLLFELFTLSGLPQETFNIFPSTNVSLNTAHKNRTGAIFVLFESCDLDSAVDAIINALYPLDILSPWYVKQIFIQESIYKKITAKLSNKISKLELTLPKDYKSTETTKKALENVNDVLKHSVNNGIEHVKMHQSFYADAAQDVFKPLIIIDNCLDNNLWEDVVKNKDSHVPAAMQAFRTTKEVLNMISGGSSYGLSLWSSNSAVSDEISLSANVNCIWTNCFGRVSPSIGLETKGGYPDLCRKILQLNISDSTSFDDFKPIKSAEYRAQVEKLSKLQDQWRSLDCDKKVSVLLKAAAVLEMNKGQLESKILKSNVTEDDEGKKSVKSAIKYLYRAAKRCSASRHSFNVVNKNSVCIDVKNPRGVIAIGGKVTDVNDVLSVIVALVVYGNAAILSTESSLAIDMCKMLADCGLPVSSFKSKELVHPMNIDLVQAFWYVSDDSSDSKIANMKNNKFMLQTKHSHMKNIISSEELSESIFSNRKLIWKTHGETFAS